jgi:hypothetical protein
VLTCPECGWCHLTVWSLRWNKNERRKAAWAWKPPFFLSSCNYCCWHHTWVLDFSFFNLSAASHQCLSRTSVWAAPLVHLLLVSGFSDWLSIYWLLSSTFNWPLWENHSNKSHCIVIIFAFKYIYTSTHKYICVFTHVHILCVCIS